MYTAPASPRQPGTAARLLLAVLCIASTLAGAAPADLERAGSLLQQGRPAEAFQLLDPLEPEHAGEPDFDRLLAVAALESGRPARASVALERIVVGDPRALQARAELGRAYFETGDVAHARMVLRPLTALPDAPPELRAAVRAYLEAIERHVALYPDWAASLTASETPGAAHAPRTRVIAAAQRLLLPAASGQGAEDPRAAAVGVTLSHRLAQGLNLFAGADYLGRERRSVTAAEHGNLSSRAGLQFGGGIGELRLAATASHLARADGLAATGSGFEADWSRTTGDGGRLSLGGRLETQGPAPSSAADWSSRSRGFTGAWSVELPERRSRFTTSWSMGYGDLRAGAYRDQRRHLTVRAGWNYTPSDSQRLFTDIGAQSILIAVPGADAGQRETTLDASVGLNRDLRGGWTLRSALNWSRVRHSGQPATAGRVTAFLALRREF